MSQIKDYFETELAGRIQDNAGLASDIGAVFLFDIEGEGGGKWTVNLKDSVGVTPGDAGENDCVLVCSAPDWLQIREQPSRATQFYFEGKLKVSGNVLLATKLQQILG